jgi:hypothetical protein
MSSIKINVALPNRCLGRYPGGRFSALETDRAAEPSFYQLSVAFLIHQLFQVEFRGSRRIRAQRFLHLVERVIILLAGIETQQSLGAQVVVAANREEERGAAPEITRAG